MNKKWYNAGIMCRDCGYIPKCTQCDITISYHLDHAGQLFGICHICKMTYNTMKDCHKCHGHHTTYYGMGLQKIAEYLTQTFGIIPVIVDSDTTNSQIKTTKRIQIIQQTPAPLIVLGTSLLSTPPQGMVFDCLIFLNADVGLGVPDYHAARYNFELLYETITHHHSPVTIIQSHNPTHYSILSACKLDQSGFEWQDDQYRQIHHYPPYSELCVIMYKNEIESNLFITVNKLHQELIYMTNKNNLTDLEIFATPPLVYKKFGKYRYHIIIKGKEIRKWIDQRYVELNMYHRGFKLDRNPRNIV